MDRMPRRVLAITTPSRLHFGLFAFGRGHQRQFGGVGLMIDRPQTRLRFASSERLQLEVADAARVRRAIEAWWRLHASQLASSANQIDEVPVSIRQVSGPPLHVGLGSGTQLTLAVAAGLTHWFQLPTELTVADSAHYGRARRSAVGTHGFFLGGLIVEQGKGRGDPVGQLDARIELPGQWRIVLACPRNQMGPSGGAEEALFDALPPVDPHTATTLRMMVQDQLVPAALAGDFEGFSSTLYEFGIRAGLCYGTVQVGPFRSLEVRQLVEFIRGRGIAGVGQSSWGPCVFAVCPAPQDAETLLSELRQHFPSEHFWFESSSPSRRGYTVSECREEPITMEEPLRRGSK